MPKNRRLGNPRYVLVHGALLNHLLSRLGWSDEQLAEAVSTTLGRHRRGINPKRMTSRSDGGGIDPKRVTSWRDGGLEKRTYAALLTTMQLAVRDYRKRHELLDAEFPSPLTLNSQEIALASAGKLVSRIEEALRLSARLFSADEERGPAPGEEINVTEMYRQLSKAILDSEAPQPFYAAVSTGEYARNILDAVSYETAGKRNVSPVTRVIFRAVHPRTLNTLVKLGVADKSWTTRLADTIRMIEGMTFSRAGGVKVAVEHWPRLPPLFAWMYGDCLAYSRCDIGDDGRIKSTVGVRCYLLTAGRFPEEFARTAALVRTGQPLRTGPRAVRADRGRVW